MARIPGLDVFDAPGAKNRPPNIFDEFFPIPDNIGNMRSEGDFVITDNFALKAPVHVAKGYEGTGNLKREICLIIHKVTKNADEGLKDILLEIRIISHLDHDNVLKFYETVSGPNLTDVAFLFEPVARFLSEIITQDVPKLYEPPVIKTIMRDLYTALGYLHQHRIIHRDIQPENIILSSTGVLKVWNFHSARLFDQKPKKLNVNEFRYQPLELIMESEDYDKSVDIWAANCVFAHLWLKKSLFPEHGREIVLKAIFKLLGFPRQEIWKEFFSIPGVDDLFDFAKYTKYNMVNSYFEKYCDRMVPPCAMDLLHKCFRYNPKHRPNAEQCLEHEYFFEEPEACPVEEIVTLLNNAAICGQIRKIRDEMSV